MAEKKPGLLKAGEIYFDLIILAFSLFLLVVAYRISGFAISAPGTFPLASTSVMVLAMLFVLWGNRGKERANKEGFVSELAQVLREVFTRDFVVYTILAIIYVALIMPFHFLPTSFVFLVVSIIYLRGSSPLKAVLISAGTLGFIYVIFLYFFKVMLP